VNEWLVNGMQGVRGSNPLSSTPGQRPSPPSTARESPASGSKLAAICPERPLQRPVGRCRRPASLALSRVDPASRGLAAWSCATKDRISRARQDRSQAGELTSSVSGIRGGARRPAAPAHAWPVSWADGGPVVTGVVRCDPVVRGPDVAPMWPQRSRGPVLGDHQPFVAAVRNRAAAIACRTGRSPSSSPTASK
jgi:hypothetical protein